MAASDDLVMTNVGSANLLPRPNCGEEGDLTGDDDESDDDDDDTEGGDCNGGCCVRGTEMLLFMGDGRGMTLTVFRTDWKLTGPRAL